MSVERSVVLCTGGFDHTIRFWEAPTGLCSRTLQYTDSQINYLAISNDKGYLAVAGNPTIRLYDIISTLNTNTANSAGTQPLSSCEGHSGNVCAVGWQKDRKWLYSCSEDGTVKIWDIRTPGYQHARDYSNKCSVNSIALHPNQGELLIGDEDGYLKIWDLTSNTCTQELYLDGRNPIRSVAIACDASIAIAANNRGKVFICKLHNTNSSSKGGGYNGGSTSGLECIASIDAHSTYILRALISPDVKFMATASADQTIKLWSIESLLYGQSSSYLSNAPSSPSNSHSSPSPTSLSSSVHCIKTLHGHTAWVWDISFSADSAYIVSASSDKTAKLWDVNTGEIILDYRAHAKAVTAIALNDSS
jgi:G protein beta subunit-like protein